MAIDTEHAGSAIRSEDLYLLAGKCFSRHLGYPSFKNYLTECTFFSADLTENVIDECYFSDTVGSLFDGKKPDSYSGFIDALSRCSVSITSSENIARLFDKKRLAVVFKLGDSFVNADFSCSINGSFYRKRVACQIYENGGHICAVFLISDVTDIYDASSKLIRKVDHDGLTGLLNHTACDERIAEYLKQYPYEDAALAVIDLDFFKRFNDQYGHDMGDHVLVSAARVLEGCFGKESVIGRTGGDEFMVLLKNRSPEEAEEEIRAFSRRENYVEHMGTKVRYTFSVGYAMHPRDAGDHVQLRKLADTAMYHVKMHHRSDYSCFLPSMLNQKRTSLSFDLGNIIDGIPGALLIYKADEGEEILFANEQLFRLFECSSMDELLKYSGDSFRNLVHPDDVERVEGEIKAQLKDGRSDVDYVSYRIITQKDRVRNVEDIGKLVDTEEFGKVFYVFLYDADEKKRTVEGL
ncbi:MAG: diguanylate cyclase [Ruminococcus sp.]|nr:diguanylate cyclase [Ruminococcus sp.]